MAALTAASARLGQRSGPKPLSSAARKVPAIPKSIARQSGHLGRSATPNVCAIPAIASQEDRFDSAAALIGGRL
jgi:hypothetical protein